jgi:hypothetical protein
MLSRLVAKDVDRTIGPGDTRGGINAGLAPAEQILTSIVVGAPNTVPNTRPLAITTCPTRSSTRTRESARGEAADRGSRLDVDDTGQGVNRELARHVFEPLFATTIRTVAAWVPPASRGSFGRPSFAWTVRRESARPSGSDCLGSMRQLTNT